jgi:PAS domain-containing protein
MLNDSDNAVFVHELTKEGVPGKFIEVNDVACQLLGYTRKGNRSQGGDLNKATL